MAMATRMATPATSTSNDTQQTSSGGGLDERRVVVLEPPNAFAIATGAAAALAAWLAARKDWRELQAAARQTGKQTGTYTHCERLAKAAASKAS